MAKSSNQERRKPGRPRTSNVVRSMRAAVRWLAKRHIKLTVRTLQNYRTEGADGFNEDGTIDMMKLLAWMEARSKLKSGSTDIKDEKLREEIRKLRIANDTKEGRLVERTWVAQQLMRFFSEVNQYRAKSEAEHPVKFAASAGDVAMCRVHVRAIWDELFGFQNAVIDKLEGKK